MFDARERLHTHHLLAAQADIGRGLRARALLVAVGTALPGEEMPPNGEQGRRVLDEDGERRQGASAHEVELAARPLLYTRARDLGAGGATHRDRALEERALAPRALDQRHVRARERHGQWQPGKSRAG